MGARIRTTLYLVLTGAMLAACSTTPPLSTRDAYIAQRMQMVDRSRPCALDPFEAGPIKLVDRAVLIPVEVNGIDTIGVLDTGAATSLITPELAQAAKIDMSNVSERLVGVAGSFPVGLAVIKKLQVGTVKFNDPVRVRVVKFGRSNGTKIGVQVGLDWLDGLDYDLDVQHSTMRPYRTANCVIIDPPWHDSATGLVLDRGFDGKGARVFRTSIGFAVDNSISIAVSFPGATLEAAFDTGSTHSLMSHEAALDAGATSSQLRADPEQVSYAINGKPKKVYLHHFPDLAIGEEELKDMPIYVTEHFDRRDTQMLLGMDYIGKHHFWLSFTTNALYIDSGERRKPVPPLDKAHWIGGSQMPAYPDVKPLSVAVPVGARCMVEEDGNLTGCRILNDSGQPAFGKAVVNWLNGAYGPVMQPAYKDGRAIRTQHDWLVTFAPP